MKKTILTLCILTGSTLAAAQEAPDTSDVPSVTPPVELPDSAVDRPERPPLPEALQEMIQHFKDQRHDVLAVRKALVEQLRSATEEERAAIMEEFRREQRDRLEAERDLRKQMRQQLEELRRERRSSAAGE